MPIFDITFLRVDRDESPTAMEVLSRTVDWPAVPREGEGVEVAEGLDAQTVESVGYDLDGVPSVHLGRVVFDDLEVLQLRKAGWRAAQLPGAPEEPPLLDLHVPYREPAEVRPLSSVA